MKEANLVCQCDHTIGTYIAIIIRKEAVRASKVQITEAWLALHIILRRGTSNTTCSDIRVASNWISPECSHAVSVPCISRREQTRL